MSRQKGCFRHVVGTCRLRRACPLGQPAGASVLVRGRHAPDALGSVRCLSSRQPVFGAPFTHLTMRVECFSAPLCRVAKLTLASWSSACTCAAARPDRRYLPHAHHSHFGCKPAYRLRLGKIYEPKGSVSLHELLIRRSSPNFALLRRSAGKLPSGKSITAVLPNCRRKRASMWCM